MRKKHRNQAPVYLSCAVPPTDGKAVMMARLKLASGHSMPVLGLGTFLATLKQRLRTILQNYGPTSLGGCISTRKLVGRAGKLEPRPPESSQRAHLPAHNRMSQTVSFHVPPHGALQRA